MSEMDGIIHGSPWKEKIGQDPRKPHRYQQMLTSYITHIVYRIDRACIYL